MYYTIKDIAMWDNFIIPSRLSGKVTAHLPRNHMVMIGLWLESGWVVVCWWFVGGWVVVCWWFVGGLLVVGWWFVGGWVVVCWWLGNGC